MAELLERRATSFIDRVRRLVAIARWGPRELVLAIVGFAALAAGTALPSAFGRLLGAWELEIPKMLQPWLPVPFWLAGGICLGLVALRILRGVTAPLPSGEPPPAALKGAGSFTDSEEDAKLFAQLGRGGELEQLRAWISDDQRPLIVLMGESGVGKTSLLRAGLTHALKRDGIEPIYWEALPNEPAAGLLHAVRTEWCSAEGAPTDLIALSAAVAASPRVLVLDQLEQLSPEAHPAVFDLLRNALLTPPPYRGTWIVAFRREYSATWVDFTLGLPEPIRHRIEILSLNRFTLQAARRIVAVLATAAQLPVDQQVVNALIDGLAVDSLVSPVDLGVTLLGLGELAGPDGTPRVSLDDFWATGGPAGLLTRYLERQLALISPAERSDLLTALLTLIDLDRNRRRAEGLTLDDLVAKVRPTSTARFEAALRFLASGKARVLEILTGPGGGPSYRLLHERFIEPVRVLSGTVLAAAAQAALRLDRAYRSWSQDRRRRLLLSGSDLQLVLRHKGQFPWGEDEPGKRDFVRRSQRQRTNLLALAVASCLGVMALLVGARNWQDRREMSLELRSFNLPDDLWKYVDQLETLEVNEGVRQLDWLHRASHLRSLTLQVDLNTPAILPYTLDEFTCNRCSSINDLRLPSHLQRLKVTGFSGDSFRHLPASLKSLEISSPVSDTSFLSTVPNLKFLSISLSPEASILFKPTDLPHDLKSLELYAHSLDRLSKDLSWIPRQVESLTFHGFTCTGFNNAPPGLRSLDLDYDRGIISRLPRTLTSLSLHQGYIVDDEPLDFRPLTGLTELRLDFPVGSRIELPASLRSISINSNLFTEVHWPPKLEHLEIGTGQLHLERLPRTLKSLALSGATGPLSSFGELPSDLLALTLKFVQAPYDLQLPRNLRSLRIESAPVKLQSLPPQLKAFSFDGSWNSVKGRLPIDLRSLDCSKADYTGDRLSNLGPLPPHLEELAVRANIQSLEGLPRSVRILRLR